VATTTTTTLATANMTETYRVYIHGGKYKGRFGTYMGKYGKVMCSIKIDGDTVQQRNLWMTSITRVQQQEDRTNQCNATRTDDNNDTIKTIKITDKDKLINITKGELLETLETLAEMNRTIIALEHKLRCLVLSE
jgi:hypothetical protein